MQAAATSCAAWPEGRGVRRVGHAGRSSTMHPRAVTCHHTAAPIDVDRILREGRADLPGPLCNWALHLDGSWWLVASGRANHAGVGALTSSESYGIECTGPVPTGNTGVDAFPMYDSYVARGGLHLEVEGWDARVVYAHKETAPPDCRKPDPAFGDPRDGAPSRTPTWTGSAPASKPPSTAPTHREGPARGPSHLRRADDPLGRVQRRSSSASAAPCGAATGPRSPASLGP